MFVYDKEIAIPQIRFGLWTVGLAFFCPLFSTVWLFIEVFIWQLWPAPVLSLTHALRPATLSRRHKSLRLMER